MPFAWYSFRPESPAECRPPPTIAKSFSVSQESESMLTHGVIPATFTNNKAPASTLCGMSRNLYSASACTVSVWSFYSEGLHQLK